MKMPDYQSQYPITPPRQAAPWQIPHPAPHHHPATTATAAFPAIQCRCGSTFPCRPVLTVFQGGFTVRQDSATAAYLAIRCRCGSTFPCRPVLTVFQGGFTVRQDSATAAFPAIRCRCGSTFPCRPVLTVFQGGFTVRQDSATQHFPRSGAGAVDGSWGGDRVSCAAILQCPAYHRNSSHLLSRIYVLTTCWTRHISPPNGHSAPYPHKSSRCLFSEHLIIRHFYKRALLDVRYTSTPEVWLA